MIARCPIAFQAPKQAQPSIGLPGCFLIKCILLSQQAIESGLDSESDMLRTETELTELN